MPDKRRYFKEIRFRQLRSLVNLKRLGSFSAVAEEQEISVPSVWQQIRALEQTFATSLVSSTGRGATLTEAGLLLANMASGIVQDFDLVIQQFRNRAESLPRRLTVATTGTLLVNELHGPLREFRRQFAGVELCFLDRPSAAARDLLLDGSVELAVIGRLRDDDLPCEGFSISPLTKYPFMLVAPQGHPLLTRQRVSMKDVVREPLVLPVEGANSRRAVNAAFARHELLDRVHLTLEASYIGVLAGYIQDGFGISLLSVSPQILSQADSPDSPYHGLGFRDMTRQLGHEEIILLRRPVPFEPEFRQAFCEIVATAIKSK